MERQAGLGRSLGEVLDSLSPAQPQASAPERALFEPEDLEQQLDALMGDMRDLRERVQHLVGLVPDSDVADGTDGSPEAPLALVDRSKPSAKKPGKKGKHKNNAGKHKKKKNKNKKKKAGKTRAKHKKE